MSVKFDSITPLPTGAAALRAVQRAAERQQRQERNIAMRREQLLDIAFGLFEEVGSQGFNMRQIAQRAGYTPGALYAYFRGKETILAALRQRVIDQLADEVRAVRSPKAGRAPRALAQGSAGPPPVAVHDGRDPDVQTRALFITQCMAWWSRLDRDPYRLHLLLKRNLPTEPPPEADTPQGDMAASVLVRLGQATAPCLDTLRALGLPADAAQQLHDEVLAYGLGLLVLQGASSPGSGAGLETRFLQTLHRWLDRERGDAAEPGGSAQGPEEPQGDLFVG